MTTNNTTCLTGIVYQKSTSLYSVLCESQFISCTLAAHLLKGPAAGNSPGKKVNETPPLTPVVVGDRVLVTQNDSRTGQITAVLPRRNQVSRRAPGSRPGVFPSQQILAANLDQIILVFAAAFPAPHWGLLDRCLVLAGAAGIPPLICITKTDLLKNRCALEKEMEIYRRIVYPIVYTSSTEGEGIRGFKDILQDKISILMGKSGVGKSSLLNALQPGLGLRVNDVGSESGKGRHTTTQVTLFNLDFGGAIMDTPGIRELGLWNIDDRELAWYFPEMRPYLGRCKFREDCRHEEEPGCAVRKAVMAKTIDPRRYQSYLKIKEDEVFQ